MRKLVIGCAMLLGGLVVGRVVMGPGYESSRMAWAETSPPQVTPVESDMHEFMEYVFEPPYKRLKGALAADPADRAAWKGIKSDSLILAEAGNLLLGRGAESDAKEWNILAEAVRTKGGELYAASKKKDAAEARQHWRGLIESCNACHQKFAGGEHILEP